MSEDPVGEVAAPVVVPELTTVERRRMWLIGLVPVVLVGGGFLVAAITGRVAFSDVLVGAFWYGGLLGLAAGVVAHERAESAHCPRCDATGALRRRTCDTCGYDLADRPMFVCERRHQRYVEPGLCDCGRRLHRLERIRGLDRELKRTLWAGAWVAAFLLGVVLLRQVV